nr:RecName: Full=Unknown protein 6 [Zinnia elegans]
IGSFIINPR